MQEIAAADFAARAPSLRDVPINHDFVRAVIEHRAEGRLWLHGGTAHLLHAYGMSLIWGSADDAAIAALTAHLNGGSYRRRDEWLQIAPHLASPSWGERLNPAETCTRVNFCFDPARFAERFPAPIQPPDGWRVLPMTADAFDPPAISVTPRAFWRDAAQFLSHGGGYRAECNGEIGAYAFTAFRFDDRLEIGIETYPAHRGKSLAQTCAAALIHDCLALGITPIWSCRKENTASYRLAQKLGFVPSLELPYYRLAAQSG